jgi:hypothetical protein
LAEFFDDVYIFDLLQQKWFPVKVESCSHRKKPSPRSGHSAVLDHLNSRVLIYGGQRIQITDNIEESVSHIFNDLWSLQIFSSPNHDGYECTWTLLHDGQVSSASKAQSRAGPKRNAHSAHLLSDKMFIVCGSDENGPSNDVYALDLSSMLWNNLTSAYPSKHSFVPAPREMHTSATLNGKIIVCGGRGLESMLDDLLEFDITTCRWNLVGLTPDRCASAACIVFLQKGSDSSSQKVAKLALIGGADASGINADTMLYDISHRNTPRNYLDTKNNINIQFGRCQDCHGLSGWSKLVEDQAAKRTVSDNTSSSNIISNDVDEIPFPARMAHAVAMFDDDRIILFGGINENEDLNDTYILDLAMQ